jgi:HEAT repeat protein/lysophospholipase L1-like esterase
VKGRLRTLRPLAQNLLLAGATALLVGATAEGLARRLETRRPVPTPAADYITRWDEGEREFYTINSTATGWPPWEDYNSEGVRDREHAVEKPPGVRRVVCLGDSVTLGTGLSVEDAYPQLLQDRLDALGAPVEVLNVALGGWATRQERLAYLRIARKYDPDLVLLGVCLNDLPELHNNLTRPPRLLGALYPRSALVRWAVGAQAREIRDIEELFQRRDATRVRAAFRRFFAEVERLQREVREDGAALAVLVFPFRGQVSAGAPRPTVQEEIASFCREQGIPFLDLRPSLLEAGEAAFADHVHLTREGTQRVADAVVESGLIPQDDDAAATLPVPAALAHTARRPDRPALLAGLAAPQADRRAAAARALGNAELDPLKTIPALTRVLGDPSPQVRSAAAWAVGRFRAQATPALPRLVAALADADAGVRAGGAWAIGKIGPPARPLAARALIQRLIDPDVNTRRRAGEALVHVGAECEGCFAALVAMVATPGNPGRAWAAFALGGLGAAARPAVAALVGALGDPRPDVRARAAWALGRIGPSAYEAVGPLVALLDDPVSGWRAIDALGDIGPGAVAAVPRLRRSLHDPSSNLRWRAAQALGQIGPPARTAAPDLVTSLRDAEGNVRLAAARAVVRIDADPSGILPALARAVGDSDSRVRVAAIRGLGRLGARAQVYVPALIAAARDPDALVRAAAATTLRHVSPSTNARAVLTDLAQHDPDDAVRAQASRALRAHVRAER